MTTSVTPSAAVLPTSSFSADVRPRVVYVVYRETLSSVLHSQVITPLSLHRPETRPELLLFTPLGLFVRPHWRGRVKNVVRRARETYGLAVTQIPSPPTRLERLWDDSRSLAAWLRRTRRGEPVVLHCRNAKATEIALNARQRGINAKVIFDCRGVAVAEYEHERLSSPGRQGGLTAAEQAESARLDAMERRAVHESDGVMCVSHAMVDYLTERYGLPPDKARVVPCCPDLRAFDASPAARRAARERLGFTDEFVVAYCGSLAWYQMPQASLRLFAAIQDVEPRARLLALTTQPERMADEVARAGLPAETVVIRSVPASEVPQLLPAADLGLLLRDRSDVNRVASPVKFGEYLAAGVPVAITEGLGDYSDLVRREGVGVVVDLDMLEPSTLAEFVKQMRNGTIHREHCRAVALAELAWPGFCAGGALQ